LAYDAKPELDTAYADSLLDAAGWRRDASGARVRDGTPFVFELLTVGSGDNALEQLVQSDLATRGIRVRIRQTELGTFLTAARAATKTFDVLVAGVPGDVGLSFLASMFDSRQRGGALDYSGFHEARLDSLFLATRRAPTDSARAAAWRHVQWVLAGQMPVAWIYHSRGLQGISARLLNVKMDLRGEMATIADWRIRSDTTQALARR
jgi:peptide/nickel transport system substrate-binding protein